MYYTEISDIEIDWNIKDNGMIVYLVQHHSISVIMVILIQEWAKSI